MAVMMILMVFFLVEVDHHGHMGSHEAKESSTLQPSQPHGHDTANSSAEKP